MPSLYADVGEMFSLEYAQEKKLTGIIRLAIRDDGTIMVATDVLQATW